MSTVLVNHAFDLNFKTISYIGQHCRMYMQQLLSQAVVRSHTCRPKLNICRWPGYNVLYLVLRTVVIAKQSFLVALFDEQLLSFGLFDLYQHTYKHNVPYTNIIMQLGRKPQCAHKAKPSNSLKSQQLFKIPVISRNSRSATG